MWANVLKEMGEVDFYATIRPEACLLGSDDNTVTSDVNITKQSRITGQHWLAENLMECGLLPTG